MDPLDHETIASAVDPHADCKAGNIPASPFSIRFSDQDRTLMEERAKMLGMSLGTFVRSSALRAANLPVRPTLQRRDRLAKAFAQVVGLLGRIASSANQIAKAANQGRILPGDAVLAIERLEKQLVAVRQAVVAQNGGRGD